MLGLSEESESGGDDDEFQLPPFLQRALQGQLLVSDEEEEEKSKGVFRLFLSNVKSYHFSCLIFCIKMHQTERGDRRERPSMLSRVSFYLQVMWVCGCVCVCVGVCGCVCVW